MKKLATLLALVFTLSFCTLAFTACGSTEPEGRVMNVSLNPQVEFLLDAENKVVSVNALNDEGNFIITQATFKGLSAEDAVEMFLKVSKENGFLVEGELKAGENEVKISISGDDVKKLYNQVVESAEEYVKTLGVNVKMQLDKVLDKEYLEGLVAQCMKELEESEIAQKTEAELLALIEKSRQQTEALFSQELKTLFYEERALEIKKAELDSFIKAVKENSSALVSAALVTIQSTIDEVVELYEDFKEEYTETYLSQASEYYQEVQEYIASKKELLKARLEGLSDQQIAALEAQFDAASMALDSIKDLATATLENLSTMVESAIDTAYSLVKTTVEALGVSIGEFEQIATEAYEKAKEDFDEFFNSEYAQYIANNYWKDLAPAE
ncbi:MAG: hypothetical protein IKD14_04175 [Clostridia bacterium]|nr:hypothetical protein [Clostridia bacterium]